MSDSTKAGDGNDDLREFVASNPGQGTLEEYRLLRDRIRVRAPGNMLIFGVGRDSGLWLDENKGGRTIFVEHMAEWIEKTREAVPGIEIIQVTYRTRRPRWKRIMERRDILFMEDLPDEILAMDWDLIFVDSPQGGSSANPGRMQSIYTASVLARRSNEVEVLVHDCHREVESAYADRYLGKERMLEQAGSMRQYVLRPKRTDYQR